MSADVADLETLLAEMAPRLHAEPVAIVFLAGAEAPPATVAGSAIIGQFRETEGLTLYVDFAAAERAGLPIMLRAAWITLDVHSALEAVGLTAAFATALGNARIPCNVVAGARHDHIFVAFELAERAMSALQDLRATPP